MFNAIDDKSQVLGPFDNFIFRTAEGHSGITQNPIFSHTIRSEVRSCEDCHLNPKALGLGEGDLTIGKDLSGNEDKMDYLYDMKKSGLTANYPYETIVTAQGHQIASTSQVGARPFNQKELARILRVGTCIPCHDKYDDPIYQNIYEAYEKAETPKHKKQEEDFLKAAKTAGVEIPATTKVARSRSK